MIPRQPQDQRLPSRLKMPFSMRTVNEVATGKGQTGIFSDTPHQLSQAGAKCTD